MKNFRNLLVVSALLAASCTGSSEGSSASGSAVAKTKVDTLVSAANAYIGTGSSDQEQTLLKVISDLSAVEAKYKEAFGDVTRILDFTVGNDDLTDEDKGKILADGSLALNADGTIATDDNDDAIVLSTNRGAAVNGDDDVKSKFLTYYLNTVKGILARTGTFTDQDITDAGQLEATKALYEAAVDYSAMADATAKTELKTAYDAAVTAVSPAS